MHIMHCTRREAGAILSAATGKRLGISLGNVPGLQLCQDDCANRRDEIFRDDFRVAFMRLGRDVGLDAVEPLTEKLRYRGLGRLDICPAAHFGDEPRTGNLCLTLRTGKTIPFATAPASLWIMDVKHDGPTAGRTLADMSLHFRLSFGNQIARFRFHPEPRSRRICQNPHSSGNASRAGLSLAGAFSTSVMIIPAWAVPTLAAVRARSRIGGGIRIAASSTRGGTGILPSGVGAKWKIRRSMAWRTASPVNAFSCQFSPVARSTSPTRSAIACISAPIWGLGWI